MKSNTLYTEPKASGAFFHRHPRQRRPGQPTRHNASSGWYMRLACAVLATLATGAQARAAEVAEEFVVERRSPQGTTWQGTALPDAEPRWLQGESFFATLEDGTAVELVQFSGDVIEAIERRRHTGYEAVRVVGPADLVGMQWTETRCSGGQCTKLWFRIADAVLDRSTNAIHVGSSNSKLGLYRVEYTASSTMGSQRWIPVCDPADGNTTMGLFVTGRWDNDGTWHPSGYTFSCARGVVSRCVRMWGYQPWQSVDVPGRGSVSLKPLHVACTRAARAEYCDNGVSYTRDSTSIDLFDVYGLNLPETSQGFTMESGWDENGAIFVLHPRHSDLVADCRDRIGSACHWVAPSAGRQTATIYVRSAPPDSESRQRR
ncbi:MAG: hypothetical protein MJE77_14785 [Proteobacteria bacterium]|nr:hypothetical protein [Pseudomonadota bacterium]